MLIYNDFEGLQTVMSWTAKSRLSKSKVAAKRDEITSDRDGCNSRTQQSSLLSNIRSPFSNRNAAKFSNRNVANSIDFMQNSNYRTRRKLRPSRQPAKSSHVGQEGDVGAVPRRSGSRKQSSSDKHLTSRQRNLRSFIAEQRNMRRVMNVEEEIDEDQQSRPDEDQQSLPTSLLMSKNTSLDTQNKIIEQKSRSVTKVEEEAITEHKSVVESLMDIDMNNKLTKEQNKEMKTDQRSEVKEFPNGQGSLGDYCNPQRSLLGTDICVPLRNSADVSFGQLSEQDDTSTMITFETESENPNSYATEGRDRNNENQLPILYLGSFQQSLWLDFGDERLNIVGKSRSLPFQLRAPENSNESSSSLASSVYVGDGCFVRVEKIPVKKGFTLNFLERGGVSEEESLGPTAFSIDNGGSRKLTLTWKPMVPGSMRETLYLKLKRGRIRIIAQGKARARKENDLNTREKIANLHKDKAIKKVAPTIGTADNCAASVKTAPSLSLGFDSNLVTSYLKENIVKNNNSCSKNRKPISQKKFARSQAICNEEWADRQCDTFQATLNFLYKHKDDMSETDRMVELETIKEQQSLRNLSLQREGAHTRQTAISFYRRPEMLAIRNAIESDVDNKRLCMRTDPYVLASVSLRNRLISLLFSYSVPWLRLGLETIFCETITIKSLKQSNTNLPHTQSDMQSLSGQSLSGQSLSGVRRKGAKKVTVKILLKRFIVERVLADSEIKKKYTRGKCMMPSGKFETLYKNAMCRSVLKRVLLLVVFLDHIKAGDILHPSPPLFNTDGVVKSSRDFLACLSKDYIHGIGNIFKHLNLIGISVSHVQSHIEELDFTITNMAIDLRDGSRLAKLAEMLCGDSNSSILRQLRLPAVSRLQKVHNIRVVLSAFSSLSIPNTEFIQPDHIVDGHRPQVLQFLWSIISHFNLSTLLDKTKLKQEIDAVHRINMFKISQDKNSRPYNLSTNIQSDDFSILLMHWCQAVCWSYDVEVTDFSKSFSDGKVICYLVHFYHPSMLQRDDILPTSSDMFHCGISVDSINKDPLLQERYRHALENERHNSSLANRRIKEIGGIPQVLPISDSTSLPDERSTIISIAYLCSRLLESSQEIISATLIQRTFRSYRDKKYHKIDHRSEMLLRMSLKRHMLDTKAATTIQKWLRQRVAMRVSRENASKEQAAKKIQANYRVMRWNRFIRYSNHQAIMIQKVWRGLIYQRTYQRAKRNEKAAMSIVRCWTKYKVAKMENLAAITIQKWSRCRCAIRSFNVKIAKHKAAMRIQSVYRAWSMKGFIRSTICHIIIIQRVWRAFFCRRHYRISTRNIVLIQKTVRKKLATSISSYRKDSIIRIQCTARRYLAFKKVISIRNELDYMHQLKQRELHHSAALVIQRNWRRHTLQLRHNLNVHAVKVVQSLVRSWITCRRRNAILKIQCAYRIWLAVRVVNGLKEISCKEKMTCTAATTCQAYVRSWIVRSAIKREKLCDSAALVIQRNWRRHILQSRHNLTVQAVQVVQKSVRSWITYRRRKAMCVRRNNNSALALKIQGMLRGATSRSPTKEETAATTQSPVKEEKAATVIQQYWRSYVTNMDYMTCICAVIKLQTFVRQYTARKKYLVVVEAVRLLQSQVRGSIARKHSKQCIESVSSIQHWWRSIILNKKIHFAVTEIQRLVRGKRVRSNLQVQHISACNIQKCWRGYYSNTNFMLMMLSMIKVQSCWRQAIAKKKRFTFLNQSMMQSKTLSLKNENDSVECVLDSLSFARLLLEPSNRWMILEIQKRWRGRMARTKYAKIREGFTLLQSLFRGQRVRNSLSRKMSAVAKRAAIANSVAEADPKLTLGVRTSAALLVLQRSKRLVEIMNAIKTLETSTGLSHNCCIAFIVAGAPKILYKLIRSCNRSLPHMELLQFTLMTLSNVSIHPTLISKIATIESIDILIDLIQMFRDKDSIFCLAATLLETLALSKEKFTVQCRKRENLKRISGVHSLCLRKISLLRNKSKGTRLHRVKPNIGISKEMSKGIRALDHILLETSNNGKAAV